MTNDISAAKGATAKIDESAEIILKNKRSTADDTIFGGEIRLMDGKLDQHVTAIYNRNEKLKNLGLNTLKIQAHILTARNNEGKSVMHLACQKGNL